MVWCEDNPSLQTLSFNDRIGSSQNGIGFNLYNDKNGYHSQVGLKQPMPIIYFLEMNCILICCHLV